MCFSSVHAFNRPLEISECTPLGKDTQMRTLSGNGLHGKQGSIRLLLLSPASSHRLLMRLHIPQLAQIVLSLALQASHCHADQDLSMPRSEWASGHHSVCGLSMHLSSFSNPSFPSLPVKILCMFQGPLQMSLFPLTCPIRRGGLALATDAQSP